MSGLQRSLLVGSLLLALAGAARANTTRTLPHRVKAGDTLSLLAAEYYGDRNYAVFIMVENQMKHARKLRAGEQIRIPVGHDVTARGGETYEALAKRYLGDVRRAAFLAASNGAKLGGTLAAGEKVRIPLRVVHEAAADEPLSMIAASYLGDRRKAELLKSYNFLESDTVGKGERIVVPIEHVRVREQKRPAQTAAAKQRITKRQKVQVLAERRLDEAYDAWRAGKYESVTDKLGQLETEYVDAETAAQINVLLGRAHVAFGNRSLARRVFEKALERLPRYTVNARDVSPTVLEVWKQAGGKVTEPGAKQ